MKRRSPLQVPKLSTLVAFESAGRLGSLSRAAKELRTSQPAVSRDIAQLEKQLSTQLFVRIRTGVRLTEAGRRFHDAVVAGLGLIHATSLEVADHSHEKQVVIACSHEVSHFYLMPRFDALRVALGESVRLRILSYHYDMQGLPLEPAADVILCWEANLEGEDRVIIHEETVRPLCSPGYATAHADILNGPVSDWGELTFLDLTRPNEGWATWDDWFEMAGRPQGKPRYLGYDSYAYVLEAAVAGHGIALGWHHFIQHYLDAGTLVGLTDGFVTFDNHYCGLLSERGQKNPLAHQCLAFFNKTG